MAPKSGEKKMKLSFFKSVGMTRKFMRYVGISSCSVILTLLLTVPAPGAEPNDGSVLPFPPSPMAGVARPRLQDSIMKWPEIPQRLPKDAPNILIVMLDDVGFGVAETFGGEVHTPTLSKLAEEGLRYNAFHTTSICSPTRAALLTGRNHTRVGLRHHRRACGRLRWLHRSHSQYRRNHRRGAQGVRLPHLRFRQVAQHPGHRDHGNGTQRPLADRLRVRILLWLPGRRDFPVGAASDRELRIISSRRNDDPKYHLTQDMVDKALKWLDDYQAFSPDKPFFMYWAPGGVHGPHHIFSEWADKYKGKFDDGWDAYRERAYKRQLEMGVIPPDTKLRSVMRPWLPGIVSLRISAPSNGGLWRSLQASWNIQTIRSERYRGVLRSGVSGKTPWFSTSLATTVRVLKVRKGRSANCWPKRDSKHHTNSKFPPGKAWWTRCLGWSEDGQHVPRRLGLGR
jgi:hypothetical protein